MDINLIVAGSRSYDDVEHVWYVLDQLSRQYDIKSVVSGLATGPDTIGKEWAESRSINVIPVEAKWSLYKGDVAGIARNAKMENIGNALIAFWDGKSTGTADMIKRMHRKMTRGDCVFVFVIDVSVKSDEVDIFE